MYQLTGIGASAGAVVGPIYPIARAHIEIEDTEDPAQSFADAVGNVQADLRDLAAQAKSSGREEAGAVLEAQALMAADPMLSDSVKEALGQGSGLQAAIETSAKTLSDMLASLPDEYMAARSADVLEVSDRILMRLAGVDADPLGALTEPSILVAATLTAAETAGLQPDLVLGFVTEEGGATSHVAVIARSLGIPAVVGAADALELATDHSQLAMDGSTGEVVLSPDEATLSEFDKRADEEAAKKEAAAAYRGARVAHAGEQFSVCANVGSPDDIERAVEAQADGVGLYRTEFLFLDRGTPPTEEEQYEAYTAAVQAFADPVVIRTFDIGGDKPAEYLDTPPEENPFLGARGVRIYEEFSDLFESQLRALLRASAHGDLWIMVPMVATVEDFLGVRRAYDAAAEQLTGEGVEIGSPKLGIMIEVPSAALTASRLAEHVDFFSIGTNDLTQYTMAADRMNSEVAGYGDAAHPAVLGLCAMTASAAREAGISTSVCGEAAADPLLAVLFAAMGIRKLSVSSPSVDLIKATIAETTEEAAAEALQAALAAPDKETVRALAANLSG